MYQEIRLIIADVDGVLTDGGITYDNNGMEYKTFHVRDGAAVAYLKRAEIRLAIVSGRRTDTVFVRAEELGIEDVYQGNIDKVPAYEELKKKYGLTDAQIACVGDDLADLPLLRRAGLSVAPADACKEVFDMAQHVTVARGGRGVLREITEVILKAQGKWAAEVERYKS